MSPDSTWDEFDRHALATFFATDSGRKLCAIMKGAVAANNERAVFGAEKGADTALYLSGRARGYRDCYAWFEALSALAGAVDTSQTEAESDVADSLAHLTT